MPEFQKDGRLIRLSKSCLGDKEKQAVLGVLDREYLGMGAEVQLFEKALSSFFGRSVACVVNGTSALQLAIQACGVGAGDEVLVPSLTYIASFQAISATGATPVACDVDEGSCLIDLHDAKKRLTERTKVIMPVHYTGGVGDLDSLYQFARENKLRVIEDAAHAFGTIYKNKRVGSFGDIACFSFDGIKNITSGEGGCVVTDDQSVICKVQDSRLLGVGKDTEKRYAGQRSWEFDVRMQGWRYHMSNIMAAIGLAQLEKVSEFAKKRQKLAEYYGKCLADCKGIKLIDRDYTTVVPHIYVVRVESPLDRQRVRANLLEFGIQSGVHYQPNHVLSFYHSDSALPLPNTEKVAAELLSLPLHVDLTFEDVDYITTCLKAIVNGK